jgi:hypothetical protein
MEMLTNSPWPGNVRELANFIERAVIVTQGQELVVPMAELHPSLDTSVAIMSNSNFRRAECMVIIDALKGGVRTNAKKRLAEIADTRRASRKGAPGNGHGGNAGNLDAICTECNGVRPPLLDQLWSACPSRGTIGVNHLLRNPNSQLLSVR